MISKGRKRQRERSLEEAWTKTLAEFDTLFPTEESQIGELRRFKPSADRCRSCKGELRQVDGKPRKYSCLRCKRRGAYLEGTLFAGITHTRAWLAAIFFLERKVKINACQFHKLLGIAYSTARTIFVKLGIVSSRELEKHERALTVSAYEFKEAFGKRSRVTASNKKPCDEKFFDETLISAEVEENSQSTERNEFETRVAVVRADYPQIDPMLEQLSKVDMLQFEHLTMPYDGEMESGQILAMLTLAEWNRLIVRMAGDHYAIWTPDFVDPFQFHCTCIDRMSPEKKCAYHKEKRWKQSLLSHQSRTKAKSQSAGNSTTNGGTFASGAFKVRDPKKPSQVEGRVVLRLHAIKTRIHRCQYYISRKYLQPYIGLTWCATDKQEWGEGKLLQACASSKPISPLELHQYNTTDNVVIFPPRMYSHKVHSHEMECSAEVQMLE